MRRSVEANTKIESTEDVLALLARATRDLEHANQAEEYRQRCFTDARSCIGKAQRAVMSLTGYPYQREQEEKVTA